MTQLGLLDLVARDQRPRKRVRQVSRAQITAMRDSGQVSARQQAFLDALAAHFNRYNVAPTIAELTAWAYSVGRLPRNDPNLMRPRASELGPGVRRVRKDGTVWIDGGLQMIEFLPKRRCRVTGKTAHAIRLKER